MLLMFHLQVGGYVRFGHYQPICYKQNMLITTHVAVFYQQNTIGITENSEMLTSEFKASTEAYNFLEFLHSLFSIHLFILLKSPVYLLHYTGHVCEMHLAWLAQILANSLLGNLCKEPRNSLLWYVCTGLSAQQSSAPPLKTLLKLFAVFALKHKF